MPEIQVFTEILVVGLFILVGLSPLFLLVKKEAKEKKQELKEQAQGAAEAETPAPVQTGDEAQADPADEDLFPFADDYVTKIKKGAIILLLAYATGAAGNRLADDLWDLIPVLDFDGAYEQYFCPTKKMLEEEAATGVQYPRAAPPEGGRRIFCNCKEDGDSDCLKVAHMLLRERSQATREWLDNRRAYIRIMRAASVALMLLLLSMGIYKFRRRGKKGYYRYRPGHFALAFFFLCVIVFAHLVSEKKFWGRVYDLYIGLPPPVQKAEPGADK